LAALVRHALRREAELSGGAAPTYLVPRVSPWPAKEVWDQFGIDVLTESAAQYLIRARVWAPEWLEGAAANPPERPLFAEARRRAYGGTPPGDPFLDGLPWPRYRSAVQRDAIHAVLTAPPGATLLASLPTGAGKSLCAYLPSLLDPARLTVIVVPTTALALDQEQALAPLLGHQVAYHGGSSPRVRARNEDIRERIRRGSQRIVFTSPESLLTTLAGPVYNAARHGHLHLLVIDEAHMVDQWGDEFRPEFQELAGLRRDLLRECRAEPFRTLLLSATVTESSLDTLETLFGQPGPFALFSSMQLRPEPACWSRSFTDEPARTARVLEALRHLPRPLLLYATRVDEAYRWYGLLRSEGFLATEVITGQTGTEERAEIVERWRRRELDVMVANSAFGLGMDKDDVRAVIHACLPETIDRYYQEVGRGGRDGNASLSLLLVTDEDFGAAEDLNQKTIITARKGYDRWRKMFFDESKQEQTFDRQSLRIDLVPDYRFGETEPDSRLNRAWNVRTLTLLDRCRVVELDAQPQPQRSREEGLSEDEIEERFRADLEQHRNRRVVRILNQSHLDYDAVWQGQVEVARRRSASFAELGLRLMREALEGKRCMAEILEEAYTIRGQAGTAAGHGVAVSKSCGGCAACRRAGTIPYAGALPTPLQVWEQPHYVVAQELERLLLGSSRFAIFDSLAQGAHGTEAQRRERLLQWLLAKGVNVLVARQEQLDRLRPAVRKVPSAKVFFYDRWDAYLLPRLPTLVYLPEEAWIPSVLADGKMPEAPRILWLPTECRDPTKPHCRLQDTIRCPNSSTEVLFARVGL
jgi:superfamily II DNA/RNA helicase